MKNYLQKRKCLAVLISFQFLIFYSFTSQAQIDEDKNNASNPSANYEAEINENETTTPKNTVKYEVEIVDDLDDLHDWASSIIELDEPGDYATEEEIQIHKYLQELMAEYHLYLAGGPKPRKRSCSALGDDKTARGGASWYGGKFHGRKTANGERFNKNGLTAAHKTLPFNSVIEVTYKGKTVLVRINDAGPYHGSRIIDLSEGAAKKLGLKGAGTGTVTLRIISCGKKQS